MKKIILIIVAIAVVLAGAWLYKNNSQKTNEKAPIKIGVATILTGDFAVAGENMVNATKLAVSDVNNSGGINGRKLEIAVEDAKCDSKGGLDAIQKLVNIDGIRYIVGGMCSNGTIAAAPIANEKRALVMTPVTGGKNVDEAGQYIFRTANSDVLAGRDLANAMLKLGYKNVGVVAEVTEYTLDIKNTFEDIIKNKGGKIVVSEEFQSDTKDYRTLIAKIKGQKPEALLILSQLGTNAAYFVKQSKEQGFEVPLFTDFTFATNENAKKIAGSFDGIYFADPAYATDNPRTIVFFDQYKQTYGIPPVIPFHAAASYDIVMMYADALRAVGDDSIKVHDWILENVKNRQGLMGAFSLDEKGNSDLGFTIKRIEGNKNIEI